MLYLFHGTDRELALRKALDIIENKMSERPDALVFKVDEENFNADLLMELCGGQGLFEQKYIVHLKDIHANEMHADVVKKYLVDVQESSNIFICTEGVLKKKPLETLTARAEKTWEFLAKEKIKKEENIFSITDHITVRDKKNAWITYQRLRQSFVPEEIHGTIFWCFKNIALVAKSKTQAETGLKPFVYSKTKRATEKYSPVEIEDRFWKLTKILGDSRRGEGELDVLLEKWMLEL